MIPTYHVDAFAERPFEGNPAAVCLTDESKPAEWMQAVAAEMNLSATAFVRPLERGFELRWFTVRSELQLCGHGTLSAAHILWTTGKVANGERIRFETNSGVLTCAQSGGFIELDFPSTPVIPAESPAALIEGIGTGPSFSGRTKFDRFLVFDSEDAIRDMKPDFEALATIPDTRGIIVTSLSKNARFDFVSRFFAPSIGLNEDPVTGSAHCALAPFWSARLSKPAMTGFQASRRGGTVRVALNGDRVLLGGKAITVMQGKLSA
jgi:PhzF family phenazine biosynthesis protein